jgi:hypothetical protein
MKIQVLSIKYKYDHLFCIYCLVFLSNAPFNNISTLSWENGRTSRCYYCEITFIRGVPIFMFFVGRLIGLKISRNLPQGRVYHRSVRCCNPTSKKRGLSWSWSYNSFRCNKCISLLTLCFRVALMVRCTRYTIMLKSLSVTCSRSVIFSR